VAQAIQGESAFVEKIAGELEAASRP